MTCKINSRPCKIHPNALKAVGLADFSVLSAVSNQTSNAHADAKKPFRPKRTIARGNQRKL